MATKPKTISSVTVLGLKVDVLEDFKNEYSTGNVGYKIPIGGLLVAALEIVAPLIRDGTYRIDMINGEVKIIKQNQN
jgi:hypothetical protein